MTQKLKLAEFSSQKKIISLYIDNDTRVKNFIVFITTLKTNKTQIRYYRFAKYNLCANRFAASVSLLDKSLQFNTIYRTYYDILQNINFFN